MGSVRAYSFDGPSYIEAIELSLKNGARCRIVADHSQCARTNQQWQAFKRLESQGAAVRLAHGTSIRSAYAEDSRDVRVGSGLRGFRRAKSILLEICGGPELVAGSLKERWSTKTLNWRKTEQGLKLLQSSTTLGWAFWNVPF